MFRFSASAFSLLTASLLATAAVHAQSAEPVRLEQPAAQSLRVRISNPTQQPGKVRVVSLQSGRVLFSQRYKDAAYGHRFEFRELPVGRYALLVHNGGQRYRYALQVLEQKGAQRTLEVSPRPERAVMAGL